MIICSSFLIKGLNKSIIYKKMENIECIHCDSKITKQNLSRHQKSELCIRIQKLNLKKENKFNLEIEKQKEENNKLKLELKNYKEENSKLSKKILTLEIKLNECIEKSEEYRKIVEKSATKSTKTVKNNYNHNNYLNYISQEPLKISEIPNKLKQIVNSNTVMYNDNEFHEHIVDNILKDKSGKDKVLCTDINRKNFSYKDEKSGELISDPELEKLREQLKNGCDIKKIRKDLLEKLVNEYEENDCIGIEPYKQFSEIIQKLNFGTPFVDHVAKKTYIKTKCNINELDIENEENE
jgi:hypothetical protein